MQKRGSSRLTLPSAAMSWMSAAHRLGDAGEAEHRVRRRWDGAALVHPSIPVLVPELTVAQDRHARRLQALLLDEVGHEFVERRELRRSGRYHVRAPLGVRCKDDVLGRGHVRVERAIPGHRRGRAGHAGRVGVIAAVTADATGEGHCAKEEGERERAPGTHGWGWSRGYLTVCVAL